MNVNAVCCSNNIDTKSKVRYHWCIVGIHTGGNQIKKINWGTFFTDKHREWILNIIKNDSKRTIEEYRKNTSRKVCVYFHIIFKLKFKEK